MQTTFQYIPIEHLQSSQYQPRQHFDSKPLDELAQSILSQGLIEPLIVRKIIPHRYEIIAGERRWRAARLAGLSELPCLIGEYSDKQACALGLIENIQRQDLRHIEEANAYQRLVHEFHYQQDEIAILVGKSRSYIANSLRLLTLTFKVKQFIEEGMLSFAQARLLVGLMPNLQESLAHQCIKGAWSVRRLEQVVKLHKENSNTLSTSSKKDKHLNQLQMTLTDQLGYPVQIITNNDRSGWLKVQFYDNDTLAGLLDRLGLSYD